MLKLLETKYDILDTIGQGAVGTVLKVKEKNRQKVFAAKYICIKDIEQEELLGIEKEINFMIQLECKHSVKLIESFKDDNFYYIISEFCDSNLDKEIKRYNGLFPIAKVKKILTQLNEVFTLMKIKKIVHRDISLLNILIKYTNNEKTDFDVKLSDYGISKRITTTQRTKSNVGYIYTKAPEVLREEDYDEKADLWSLGVVIYYLCLKKWPFDGKKRREIEQKIESGVIPNEMPNSPLITDLIIKLLQPDCNKRLNWDEYLNHPFFKKENNNYIIQEKVFVLSKVDDLYREIREKSRIYKTNNTELINIIESDKRLRPSKIMEYVNSKDNEISIIGLLLLIVNYSNFFDRPFIENFFYEKNTDNHKQWEINIYNNKTIFISDSEKEMLKEIMNKIFKNFNYILSTHKKEETENNCSIFYLDSLFELLCNIYDLDANFYKSFFEAKWIDFYLKLFEFYIDFNNLPKVAFGRGYDYQHLEKFLNLFNLCMGKDIDFSQRLKIIENKKELFLKTLQISTYVSGICCCYHSFSNATISCHKAIDTILKALSYIEKNNISFHFENEKYIKIKYAHFLSEKYDKNVCIVHLIKISEILSNKDIFKYLIEETDLFKNMIYKEVKTVHHCIDELENFVNICEYPQIFLKVLTLIDNNDFQENRAYYRIYREIVKKILQNCPRDFIEEKIYKNEKILKYFIMNLSILDLIETEGIYDILLNPDNPHIIEIFYKNHFDIGYSCMRAVINLSNFSDLKINALVRIMNRFLSIGQKIKEKYNVQNYYVNELKSAFQMIGGNDSDEYKELKKYFEN